MTLAILVLTVALAGSTWGAQRTERAPESSARVRPPEDLPCSRNELTSFTGQVVSYERTPARIRLQVKTDWDTDEHFELRLSSGKEALRGLLLAGKPFQDSDWNIVEASPGKLKPGMRVTVWVCEGILNPAIDWRPPPPPERSVGKPQGAR